MKVNSIWSILEEGFDILGGYGYPAMDKAAAEMGLDNEWITWVSAIWLFGSEPITTAVFMRMFPYGLAYLNEERFKSSLRQGYLMSNGKSGYSPSEAGMKAAGKKWREAGDSLAKLQPMPEKYLQRLLRYLDRVVESSIAMPEQPSHYYLSHKKDNYQRLGTMYPLEYFVIIFGKLAAYRDDMYVAAWQVYQIEGHAWDIFDKIYLDEMLTFDDLYAKLKGRGLPQEIYSQDLQELIKRGWVRVKAGGYQISPVGKKVREDVEAETDNLFFAPWSCLNETEMDDLLYLAIQIHDGLQSPKEKI